MFHKTLTAAVVTTVLVAVACSVLVSADPSVFPAGTTIYRAEEAHGADIYKINPDKEIV